MSDHTHTYMYDGIRCLNCVCVISHHVLLFISCVIVILVSINKSHMFPVLSCFVMYNHVLALPFRVQAMDSHLFRPPCISSAVLAGLAAAEHLTGRLSRDHLPCLLTDGWISRSRFFLCNTTHKLYNAYIVEMTLFYWVFLQPNTDLLSLMTSYRGCSKVDK